MDVVTSRTLAATDVDYYEAVNVAEIVDFLSGSLSGDPFRVFPLPVSFFVNFKCGFVATWSRVLSMFHAGTWRCHRVNNGVTVVSGQTSNSREMGCSCSKCVTCVHQNLLSGCPGFTTSDR